MFDKVNKMSGAFLGESVVKVDNPERQQKVGWEILLFSVLALLSYSPPYGVLSELSQEDYGESAENSDVPKAT
jgi:hypothetical protein